MRKKTRGRIEILADIIFECQEGLKKTHIMLRANLGYDQLCYYLPLLINTGLVTQAIEADSIIYRTTENGREFLKNYYGIMGLIIRGNLNLGKQILDDTSGSVNISRYSLNLATNVISMHENEQK